MADTGGQPKDDIEARRGPITLGLMLTALMITLDTTMVNVSLPNIGGNISAAPDQITWVLTSFIVAQAVMTPISGWMAARIGMKTMLLGCVCLFTLASMLCGMATSLPQMVLFRLAQGITGAPMLPLTQAVLLNINPPERSGRAMALFAMATVAGPIIGPVLGAYITDQFSWRWCFYINVPTGIASFLVLWAYMPHQPPQKRRFDFLGFGSLAVGVAALQLMLDRGTSQDWFSSQEIWIETIIAAVGLWIFVTHSATAEHPLFDPELIGDRNFVSASLVSVSFTTLMFASIALLPILMQTVLGYPVLLTGMMIAPRGVLVLAMLQVIGRLDSVVDRRVILATGMGLLAFSFWQMAQFNLDMTPRTILFASMTQGLGQSLISVPLLTLAFATLRPELRADGSSISNLIRMLAGSIGIALMQGLTVTNGQRMHEAIAAHVNLADPVVRAGLPPGFSPTTLAGAFGLNAEITRQADMVAYVDDFRLMALIALFSLPLLLLLRQTRQQPTDIEVVVE